MTTKDLSLPSPIAKAWNYIKADIKASDPQVEKKKTPFLSRLYHAINDTFSEVELKIKKGQIDPYLKFKCLKFSQGISPLPLHETDRPIRVGFLPVAGNPLWWGHLLVAFMAQNALNLDSVVIRVQGEIRYKNLPETDRVPVKNRHGIIKHLIDDYFFPLLRYTDLGFEPNNEEEGSHEMHNFLNLNKDKKIQMYYLVGIENKERVEKYFTQQYEAAKKFKYDPTVSRHQVVIGWIQRGEYGAKVTQKEIEAIGEDIRKKINFPHKIPICLVKGENIDLQVSSTYYRNTHDEAILPRLIDKDAKEHGFYGHPPIDPRTGKPYDYSEEEYFRVKLRPVAEGIANQIVRKAERDGHKNSLVIGIDGPSGSGKTTIAEETAKYLGLRGYNSVHLSLDIFLKEKVWRTAVEKKAVGESLSEQEKQLLGKLEKSIKIKEPFLEEEIYWDEKEVLRVFKELDQFIKSKEKACRIFVPNGYNRQTKIRQNYEFNIKKEDIIIIDGKYSNQPQLAPYSAIHYRLEDHPDRTKAKFEIRTRSLSPNTADIQMAFYEIGLIPSYVDYAQRTKQSIDYIIDLKTDDWQLVPAS